MILIIIFISRLMSARYKDNTFHMMQTFNKTTSLRRNPEVERNEVQTQLRGTKGSTWDAKHMTNFLNRSNYSNWVETKTSFMKDKTNHLRSNSTGDHFFKTTKDNKNASKIGYTKINPLVSSVEIDKIRGQRLTDFLKKQSPERYSPPKHQMVEEGNFKFQGNSVKYRKTDPLTLQHDFLKNPSNFQKERMMRLISKRHPHGMTGVDHPENVEPKFYQSSQNDVRIRMEPNAHQSFVLDREWKSKGRVSEEYKELYRYPKGNFILKRKFNNDDAHGYNIVTNRKSVHE